MQIVIITKKKKFGNVWKRKIFKVEKDSSIPSGCRFFKPAMLSGIMALDCDNMLSVFDSKMKEIYIGLGLAHDWPEDEDEINDNYIIPEGA